MPMLMEKTDWIRTAADVGAADRIWYDDVSGDAGDVSISLPEDGHYQVFLVKIDAPDRTAKPRRKSAHEFIGYGRRFNSEYRSTAEVMADLREGEKV